MVPAHSLGVRLAGHAVAMAGPGAGLVGSATSACAPVPHGAPAEMGLARTGQRVGLQVQELQSWERRVQPPRIRQRPRQLVAIQVAAGSAAGSR